jgi:putative FmdB family regulatory protein
MPIYEYVCMSCESHFEELVRHDESPKCPDCGTVKVQRQLSVFAASKAKPAVKTGGGPAPFSGGCGHGSCGCH